jgi:hypothetical protein
MVSTKINFNIVFDCHGGSHDLFFSQDCFYLFFFVFVFLLIFFNIELVENLVL